MSSTIPFDAYKGSDPFIFVSYAHKDRESVFPLILALHEQGFHIWYDEGIDPGNKWAADVARALKDASQFLVFISPSSILSKNVNNEISFALNRDKGFIAVHLVETQLTDELDLRMGDIQAILKWRMSDEHFSRKLAGSLSPALKGPPASATTLRVNAAEEKRVLPTGRVPTGCRAAERTVEEPYSKSGCAQEIVHEATGMVFRFIPPGSFTMGSAEGELGRKGEEVQHRVTLTRGFYLGKYLVTQAQWEKTMISSPSGSKGPDLPVEKVSWDDCQAFLKKLGTGARLPTEAEWEYACRAGTTTALNSGKALTSTEARCPNLDEVAWYRENSGGKTHPVGQKQPNGWGLYDMHGNVWEWCSDWYGSYPTGEGTNPQGVQSGSRRVLRGGGWYYCASYCRAACRYDFWPKGATEYIGFRAVLPLGQP